MKLCGPRRSMVLRSARIPRRNRRGLIEARSDSAFRLLSKTGEFPGEIAGASLKRAEGAHGLRELRGNSPAKSPGPH